MHQIVCDKCQRTERVQWTQMFVGWIKDGRPIAIRPGYYTPVNKAKGEYLELLGHGSLPIPLGWEYLYNQELVDDNEMDRDTHLCPDCRTPDAQDD